MIGVGIDAGSRAVKVVLMDRDSGEILGRGCVDQGIRQEEIARALLEEVLERADLEWNHVGRIVATGYGRNLLEFADQTVTEITCHARGVYHLASDVRTVIEIGGQDSKLLRLDGGGRVEDFMMNDRCAAGTGRFLEIVAGRLEVGLGELGRIASQAKDPADISSMCVVFAETEIIGLLASGADPADIVAGIQTSMARRIAAMAGRRIPEPIYFTGGVARIAGMAEALGVILGKRVLISPEPQMTGAIGAALVAAGR